MEKERLEAEEGKGWLVEEGEQFDAEEGCSVGNAGGFAAKDNDYNNSKLVFRSHYIQYKYITSNQQSMKIFYDLWGKAVNC